ncbi:Uncharacterized protein Fot_50350 [Forsythia ovata]|uniref:Uncharacterized protein n=1 Tax=Forsythia ovata TaxID=205694 RepID=A0ABD1Q0T4_9LAMI
MSPAWSQSLVWCQSPLLYAGAPHIQAIVFVKRKKGFRRWWKERVAGVVWYGDLAGVRQGGRQRWLSGFVEKTAPRSVERERPLALELQCLAFGPSPTYAKAFHPRHTLLLCKAASRDCKLGRGKLLAESMCNFEKVLEGTISHDTHL